MSRRRPPPTAPPPRRYRDNSGRVYTREQLQRLAGWHEAVQDHPEHDLVVLFHTVGDPYVGLVAFPRRPPRSGLSPPFWAHGEVMHIERKPP